MWPFKRKARRSSVTKEPSVEEIVAHVEKGGSYMRVIPHEEAQLRENADSMIKQASEHMDCKQYEQAIEKLGRVLDVFPNHFGAYLNRGLAYSLLGNHLEAIADYNRALRIKPDFVIAYMNLAHAYESLGQKDRALENARLALKHIPPGNRSDIAVVERRIQELSKP